MDVRFSIPDSQCLGGVPDEQLIIAYQASRIDPYESGYLEPARIIARLTRWLAKGSGR